MTESLVPGLVAATAVALTYLMCIRPMRHGHCHRVRSHPGTERAEEIEQLRVEIARLQQDLEQQPGE